MSKKDSGFPAATLGRSLGTRLQGSNDSLSHPLLSASPQNVNGTTLQPQSQPPRRTSETVQDPLGTSAGNGPKYVPYTPRHRPSPGSPTTSTSTQTSPSVSVTAPQAPHGGVAGKLQMQNMKAAAQALGLGTGSVGWAMLEHFVGEGDLGKWQDAWNMITTGKATLLLPNEQLSGSLDISSNFINDHVVFCNGPSSSSAPLVTLSGLRGTIENDKIVFRSSVPTSSAFFKSLLNVTTRSSTLLTAPALPHPVVSTLSIPYPEYALGNFTATLPCPQRHVPPPVQPQDSAVKNDYFTISAFVIDRPVRRKQVLKEIQRCTKAQIKDTLGSTGMGLPNWIVTRTVDLASLLHGLYSNPGRSGDASPGAGHGDVDPMVGRSMRLSSRIQNWQPDLGTVASTTDSLQEFFSTMEDDLTAYWNAAGSATTLRRKKSDSALVEDEKAPLSRHGSTNSVVVSEEGSRITDKERRIREAMNAIERVICCLFYDKLFAPEGTDDKSHDEALSNRVAALNMLDLTLEHLGVEAGEDAKVGVEKVVQAVGRELQRLEDPLCRSPGEKAAILVTAHNAIVDGLAKLPPISLKPEGEVEPPVDPDKTPMAPTFPKSVTNATVPSSSEAVPSQVPSSAEESPIPSQPPTSEPPSSQPPSQTSAPLDVPPTISLTPVTPSTVEATLTSSPTSTTNPASDVLSAPTAAPNSTPVSSDVLLPILIYSVVKSNPTQLVSHVLYVQRYRYRSAAGGEEGFCLINVMAVAEFLENVDMAALGLTEADRVSVADLDPIPIPADAPNLSIPQATETNLSARLRGKVEQQVGELAGSANKVLSGVVDSSFSALRGFLGGDNSANSPAGAEAVPPKSPRQGFGMLRRGSGFSIASVAASLPGGLVKDRRRTGSLSATLATSEETGQQMIEVPSRPGSIKSVHIDEEEVSEDGTDEISDSDSEDSDSEHESNVGPKSDVRSIRSFGSMLSEVKDESRPRKSLTDRLANVSARIIVPGSPSREPSLRKPSPPPSRRASLILTSPRLQPLVLDDGPSPLPRIPPPNTRLLECNADDLKVGEIPLLLKEYRRMVDALRARGAFQDAVDLA
ncbi:hypothetical protein FRB99_007867 [Tulasnella sp. 403]|nr:hypothetical protein FRB99_007867 [Tulasnella sp. 403]